MAIPKFVLNNLFLNSYIFSKSVAFIIEISYWILLFTFIPENENYIEILFFGLLHTVIELAFQRFIKELVHYGILCMARCVAFMIFCPL